MASKLPTTGKIGPKFSTGIGRRKSAVARVRLTAGKGHFTIAGELASPLNNWLRPLRLVGHHEDIDAAIILRGGGRSSRAQAVTLALARALVKWDESFKTTLRKAGLLTVDARVKERKKPGLKRARKAPQWQKR